MKINSWLSVINWSRTKWIQLPGCKTDLGRCEKKLDAHIIYKWIHDGVSMVNGNTIITNISNDELDEDEISVLEVGLKHNLFIRPCKSEMFLTMEDVYDQILIKQNILKGDRIGKHWAQTAVKVFMYNYMVLDVKQFFSDRERMKTRWMILKPQKGQIIV